MPAVDDVLAYLAAQGVVDGSSDFTGVPRTVPPDPDAVVILTEDGGPAPELWASSGMGEDASQFSQVQVRTRAAPWQHDTAYTKAREAMDALHTLSGQTLGSTVYDVVYALTSEPVFIGYDSKDRPEFTQSFRLMSPVPA